MIMGLITKKFKLPIFHINFIVYIFEDESQLPPRLEIKNLGRDGYTVTWDDLNKVVICLHKDCSEGTIVHECNHSKNFVLKFIGQTSSNPYEDDEVDSYILQYIFEKVNKIFKSVPSKESTEGYGTT
jgi:hypothetical protein